MTQDEVDNVTKFALVFFNPLGPRMSNKLEEKENSDFNVVMSPNPFDKEFTLHLESPLRDKVTVTIYDIVGKKISSNEFSYEELNNYVFGKSLSSGVYQAVIKQGEYKEIIRIIKK